MATLETNKANVADVYTKTETDTALTTKLSDAPSDGTSYGRKDGAWAAVTAA